MGAYQSPGRLGYKTRRHSRRSMRGASAGLGANICFLYCACLIMGALWKHTCETPASTFKNKYFHPLNYLARRAAFLAIIGVLGCQLSGCGLFSAKVDTGPAPVKARKVVNSAYAQMGKKYISGGSSPQKGFDCSGLIWWAYRQHGMKVPRITVDQAKTGKGIPKKHARAGDIMVFKVGNSPRGLHTGIYAGKGHFIHSPRKGKTVRMENLAPFWHKRLVAVRRVVEN